MYMFHFFYLENMNQYKKVEKTDSNPTGLIPKANCSKKGIRDYLKFTYSAISRFDDSFNDNDIFYDKKRLASKLIEMYKELDCYKLQTDQQRNKTVKYIQNDPLVEIPFIDF